MRKDRFWILAAVLFVIFAVCSCTGKTDTAESAASAAGVTETVQAEARGKDTAVPEAEESTETSAAAETEDIRVPENVEPEEEIAEPDVAEENIQNTAGETCAEEETSESVEAPLCIACFSYRGVDADITAYGDHAVISFTSDVDEDDVLYCAELLMETYPESAAVEYRIEGSRVTLSYPAQGRDVLTSVIAALEGDAEYLIDSFKNIQPFETVALKDAAAEAEKASVSQQEEAPLVTMKEAEAPLYFLSFSYRGIEADVTAYTDHAIVTLPEGTTDDDITECAALFEKSYPEAAAVTTYDFYEDVLMLYYPETDGEFIEYAVFLLASEAEYYIDSLMRTQDESTEETETPAKIEAVSSAEDSAILRRTFSYRFFTSDVTAYSDCAILTLPEGTDDEDIAYLASLVVISYPEAEYVTYTVGDGIVSLSYPECSREYIEAAYSQLASDAVHLIDSLVERDEIEIESVIVRPAIEEERAVLSGTFSYKEVTSDYDIYSDHAYITLPDGAMEEDVNYVASLVVDAYPESEAVTYSVNDSVVGLLYPEQSDSYLFLAASRLEEIVENVIDSFTAVEPVAGEFVEEETPEEDVLFSKVFSYRGVVSEVCVYEDHASLTLPNGTTGADITSFASLIVRSYPEAESVEYSVSDSAVTLSYPQTSRDFLLLAYDVLEREAEYYIDAIIAGAAEAVIEAETEIAAEETETVAEEAGMDEALPEVEEENDAYVAPSSEADTEIAVEEDMTQALPEERTEKDNVASEAEKTETVSPEKGEKSAMSFEVTPAVSKTAGAVRRYSVAASFSGSWNFAGFGISAKGFNASADVRFDVSFTERFAAGAKASYTFKFRYLEAKVYGMYTFFESGKNSVYALAAFGADITFVARKVGFVAEAGAGYQYSITDHISAFAEISGLYSTIRRFDITGYAGVRYTF